MKAVEETVTITRDAPVESVVEATETTEDAEGRAPQVVAALQNLEGVIGESVTLEATVQGTVPHLSGLHVSPSYCSVNSVIRIDFRSLDWHLH